MSEVNCPITFNLFMHYIMLKKGGHFFPLFSCSWYIVILPTKHYSWFVSFSLHSIHKSKVIMMSTDLELSEMFGVLNKWPTVGDKSLSLAPFPFIQCWFQVCLFIPVQHCLTFLFQTWYTIELGGEGKLWASLSNWNIFNMDFLTKI